MIEFVDNRIWLFGQDSTSRGGLVGQVTKCRWNGEATFYVRENIRGVGSFLVSSGERWGDKNGSKPRRERWSLDLLATDDQWDVIAEQVRLVDIHHRPVLRSKSFTWTWAEELFQP
jgi:hypothetical protein